ncbi:MAG TPA: protein-disulfide reductase DsbD domain-containing protein, partial [Acetobacteraceae bacterium]|nr:protein-disulfide reductase DsbD domain-containing protein [Acetobacteraceae bacterium]
MRSSALADRAAKRSSRGTENALAERARTSRAHVRSSGSAARRWLAGLIALVGLYAWPASPQAAIGPWASGQTVRARLLTATNATGTSGQIHAGLQVILDEGWDTYWRSPGDAGAPPRVDWSGSTNVASVEWRWPAPARLSQFDIDTFGYLHETVFPLIVHPKRSGEPVALRGAADLLVCSTICVPKHLELSLDLPAGPATADPEAANLIARFDARVPDDGALSGLRVNGISAEPGTPGFLEVRITSRQPLKTPDV